MEILNVLKIIFFGIIEGITEWLPVSSTGHLILFEKFCPIKNVSAGFAELFEYLIQLGAIFAVVVLFWKKLFPLEKTDCSDEQGAEKTKIVWKKDVLTMWLKVIVACVPAVFAIAVDQVFEKLSPLSETAIIAGALIVYGIVFILVEKWNAKRNPKVTEIAALSYKYAFFIGCFQVLAAIPGTSRSGITIIGALLLGVDRKTSAEFTFFLAIPTMVGTSDYKILKFLMDEGSISGTEIGYILIGMAVAFAVSMLAIKFLMNFVKKHDFKVFGAYRILLGAVVIGALIIPALL
ncbi:MAG: undecaprenyl-diphosphate phosphatase [Clostridia bacterium]|nr:undecaprenyl-diphosphate phosphatase [Clostridia bacterium]